MRPADFHFLETAGLHRVLAEKSRRSIAVKIKHAFVVGGPTKALGSDHATLVSPDFASRLPPSDFIANGESHVVGICWKLLAGN